MPFIVHWFMTACRGTRKSFQCHFFFQQTTTGRSWGYATELWLFTLLVLTYFLKEHTARQQSGRLLSCPTLAGKAVAEKEFPLYPECCWADSVRRNFWSQDVAGGAGGGGRAGREPAAQGQTTREQQVAAFFLQGTDSQTGLKGSGRKRFGCQSFVGAQKPQNTAGWENRIGRKGMPSPHGLAVGFFSDFGGLNFPP